MKLPRWLTGGSRSAAAAPVPPERDLVIQCTTRVYDTARHTALKKYRRTIQMDDPKNIEQDVTLPDCLLVSFYWHATAMMTAAGVDQVGDLTGSDRSNLACMAFAFDLSDEAFERVCGHLPAPNVEKARLFRGKWIDAHARQPRIAEILKDARARAADERRARVKRVESLHQESSVEAAYEFGRLQLQVGGPLAEAGQSVYFLLAYGVVRARALESATAPDWAAAPTYAGLTNRERAVVACLHQLLAHASDTGVHMDLMSEQPAVAVEIAWIPEGVAELLGNPLAPPDLPTGPRQQTGTLRQPLWENVLTLHLLWDTAHEEELDLKR